MFVHPISQSVDAWFARRLDPWQPVARPPRHGMARARHEEEQFGRAVVARGIAAVLLEGMVLIAPEGTSTAPLIGWYPSLGILLAVWFVVAASYTVIPKKAPTGRR